MTERKRAGFRWTAWVFAPLLIVLLLVFAAQSPAGPAHRIISLAPNTTEILFGLGLKDSIVGVDAYSDYPEEAKDIESLGTFESPNMEKIVLLKADYILVNSDMDRDRAAYLKEIGAEVIKISPGSVDELCDDIKMLGHIFDREDRASEIVQDIKGRLRRISGKIAKNRPKVFVQLFDDPLITVSSFIGDAIALAGGDNIAYDIKDEAGLFSYEILIHRDPDIVIIVGFSGETNLPDSISAVKNDRVYKNLDPDIILRPGPRIIEGIEELNRIFYEKS